MNTLQRQQYQRRRTCHTVHHADKQRAQWKPAVVVVMMVDSRMNLLTGVGMHVKMQMSIGVAVDVEVDTLA